MSRLQVRANSKKEFQLLQKRLDSQLRNGTVTLRFGEEIICYGGPGSGYHGHAGRPGEQGGSPPSGAGGTPGKVGSRAPTKGGPKESATTIAKLESEWSRKAGETQRAWTAVEVARTLASSLKQTEKEANAADDVAKRAYNILDKRRAGGHPKSEIAEAEVEAARATRENVKLWDKVRSARKAASELGALEEKAKKLESESKLAYRRTEQAKGR